MTTTTTTAFLVIDPDGLLRFIHDDRLAAALTPLGRSRTRRASHVEPTDDGRWTADMGPSGGPMLGPFRTRGRALAEERRWLRRHALGARP